MRKELEKLILELPRLEGGKGQDTGEGRTGRRESERTGTGCVREVTVPKAF